MLIPNRWKLVDADDNEVIEYFQDEQKAYDTYARFDLDKRSVILYSCYEDHVDMTEWEHEEWNCDLDTGTYDEQ